MRSRNFQRSIQTTQIIIFSLFSRWNRALPIENEKKKRFTPIEFLSNSYPIQISGQQVEKGL